MASPSSGDGRTGTRPTTPDRPRLNAASIEPPDPAQAARLLDTACERDPALRTFLWLAAITDARRGELVALRWTDIRWQEADRLIQRGYVTRPGQRIIKDTRPTRSGA